MDQAFKQNVGIIFKMVWPYKNQMHKPECSGPLKYETNIHTVYTHTHTHSHNKAQSHNWKDLQAPRVYQFILEIRNEVILNYQICPLLYYEMMKVIVIAPRRPTNGKEMR